MSHPTYTYTLRVQAHSIANRHMRIHKYIHINKHHCHYHYLYLSTLAQYQSIMSTAITPSPRYKHTSSSVTAHKKSIVQNTKSTSKSGRGSHIFYQHYQQQYSDNNRWNSTLLPALLKKQKYVMLLNQYMDQQHMISTHNTPSTSMNHTILNECKYLLHKHYDVKQMKDISIDVLTNTNISSNHSELKQSNEHPYLPPHEFLSYLPTVQLQQHSSSSLLPYYLLDGASLYAVELLCGDLIQPQRSHSQPPSLHTCRVLDVCAAPGGKSLAILQYLALNNSLNSSHVSLTCNEYSTARRQRLQNVLKQYIPTHIIQQSIQITSIDATHQSFHIYTHQQSNDTHTLYDRILVDAPCSSTRHVLQDATELNQWNLKTIEKCMKRQTAIIITAYKVLKPDTGRLVYATCSIDQQENDDVIETFLQKMNRYDSDTIAEVISIDKVLSKYRNEEKKSPTDSVTEQLNDVSLHDNVQSESKQHISSSSKSLKSDNASTGLSVGQSTKYGWMFLPDDIDRNTGLPSEFGPLYVACIQKVKRRDNYSDSTSNSSDDEYNDERSATDESEIYESKNEEERKQ